MKPQYSWIWRAWHTLHDDRVRDVEGISAGLGGTIIRSRPGRIPWSKILLWARHERLTRPQIALLQIGVRVMDDVYLKDWAKRSKIQT